MFDTKFGPKNFKKSPNLVTLLPIRVTRLSHYSKILATNFRY